MNNNTPNTTPSTTKEQVLLYYGIQESECDANVYHAFRAVDPAATTDDEAIAKDLAEQLDTEPGNDDFQMRSMYIDLPASLVKRIQEQAIRDFLETSPETVHEKAVQVLAHPTLQREIGSILEKREMAEDIKKEILQRPDCDREFSDEDICKIAEHANRRLSDNDGWMDDYWNNINWAIDDFLDEQRKSHLFGGKDTSGRVFYHITPVTNVHSIKQEGLLPYLGPRAATAGESQPGIWLLTDMNTLENCLMNWAGDYFPCTDLALAVVRVELPADFLLIDQPLMPCEKVSRQTIPTECLSFYTEDGIPLVPVGRLNFYATGRSGFGKIRESIEYYSEESLVADVKQELNAGVPLGIVLYRDKDGCTISRDFLMDLDTMPLSLTVEVPPKS